MTTLTAQHLPRPRRRAGESATRWQARPMVIFSLIIAYAGILLITYPTAASWVSQYHQSLIVREMSTQIQEADPSPAAQILEAQQYNEALSSGAILESNANIAQGDATQPSSGHNYFDLLSVNGSGYMGRIVIPKIDLDLPVYHGTSEEVLGAGIGHLQGTSLPVGGPSTRAVLTGHRGLAHAAMFTHLDQIVEGDTFSVSILGEVFSYTVRDVKVIAPEETESIRPEEGKDLMTLITCTPLGINSHRILVTGERLYPVPQEELDSALGEPDLPRFPWWIVWLLASFVVLVAYGWWVGRPLAPRSEQRRRVGMQHRERVPATSFPATPPSV